MRTHLGIKIILPIIIVGCIYICKLYCPIGHSESNVNALLHISGIRGFYKLQEPIKFEVENNTNKIIFYYCVAETNRDQRWQELSPVIGEKVFSKTVRLHKILPNQIQNLSWDYGKQKHPSPIKPGFYRIRIEETENPGKTTNKFYSNEFRIKE